MPGKGNCYFCTCVSATVALPCLPPPIVSQKSPERQITCSYHSINVLQMTSQGIWYRLFPQNKLDTATSTFCSVRIYLQLLNFINIALVQLLLGCAPTLFHMCFYFFLASSNSVQYNNFVSFITTLNYVHHPFHDYIGKRKHFSPLFGTLYSYIFVFIM